MRDLNPTLAQEATAVVTRFTLGDRVHVPGFEATPVMAKLFARADMIKMLARGFRTECKTSKEWTEEKLTDLLDPELESPRGEGPGSIDWRMDLLDCYSYLARYFRDYRLTLSPSEFGQWLMRTSLTDAGYTDLACQLFWEGSPALSEIFKRLLEAHAGLFGGHPYAMLSWEATHFILDSSRQPEWDGPDDAAFNKIAWKKVKVHDQNGKKVLKYEEKGGSPVDYAIMQGLVAELRVPLIAERLPSVGRKVLDKADCLDIPGAIDPAGRAGKSLDELEGDPELGLGVLKRGRVGFLFDKYADELQANVLLYLHRCENMPARAELVPQLDRWGKTKFGDQWPEGLPANEVEQPTMFVALTAIDKVLGLHSDQATFSGYLQTMAQEFSSWFKSYGGKDQPFKNVFLLRYPDTLDTLPANKRKPLWKECFLQGDAIKQYVEACEQKWDAVFESDGGLAFLLDRIAAVLSNDRRRSDLEEKTDELERRLAALMRSLYVDPAPERERKRRTETAQKILNWLGEDKTGSRTRAIIDALHCETEVKQYLEQNDGDLYGAMVPDIELVVRANLDNWLHSRQWGDLVSGDQKNSTIDQRTLGDFGRYIHDYLTRRCLDEMISLVERAERMGHEQEKAIALKRFASLVMDDFLITPGRRPPLESSISPDGAEISHRVLHRRWSSILATRLCEGVEGHDGLPPGNNELGELLKA
jgi:hypothetical protein